MIATFRKVLEINNRGFSNNFNLTFAYPPPSFSRLLQVNHPALRISAGNYGGKLGKYKISLSELL